MIIKLSKAEQKTLSALDPKKSGTKPWLSAREVGVGVFRKKLENLTQGEIREVRNAFRKLVRENLVEMSATERGKYQIHDRGRRLLSAGATEFEGRFLRGEATKAAKAAGAARLKTRPKPAKKATKKATKKVAKKAAPKKASKKKATKKATKKRVVKKSTSRAKVKVVDRTKDASTPKAAKGSNGRNSGNSHDKTTIEHKKPRFKRRQAMKYANSKTSGE